MKIRNGRATVSGIKSRPHTESRGSGSADSKGSRKSGDGSKTGSSTLSRGKTSLGALRVVFCEVCRILIYVRLCAFPSIGSLEAAVFPRLQSYFRGFVWRSVLLRRLLSRIFDARRNYHGLQFLTKNLQRRFYENSEKKRRGSRVRRR